MIHPEGGHMYIQKHKSELDFKGVCAFHGCCLEGLTTNVSIATRKCISVNEVANISDDDPLWEVVAFYLGQACANLAMILSVEKIVLGGGVSKQKSMLMRVRKQCKELLNGYLLSKELENMPNYIVGPHYEQNNGIISAIGLAE